MLVLDKENQTVVNELPLILALNKGGEAMGWINYERACFYEAKNKVIWRMGRYEVILRGGTNAKTGLQSTMSLDTIIAIDYDKSPTRHRKAAPTLTNKTLFNRDRHICAYCGGHFKYGDLTRDHVHPVSKGGPDSWENCVASCRACNQWKDNKTVEEAGLTLLYVPYQPTFNEHLILQNRRIIADQMEWLMKGVSKNSRLHS